MKTREILVGLGLTSKKADEIMMLESRMLENAVKFQFKKKDSSLRDAVGTLDRSKMIQEDGSLWEPKGEAKPDVPSLLKFWDLEAKGWKCLTVANLVSVEG